MFIDSILSIDWRSPALLWLCLLPFVLLLLRRLCVRNRLDNFADRHLHPWVVITSKRSFTKTILSRSTAYILAWILLVIAAAGPRLPDEIPGTAQNISHNVYIVVDISRSMRATDTEPDRLRRARIELYELLLQTSNARVGIIVYTASNHMLAPLSYDMSLIASYIQLLGKTPSPTYGSDPVGALALAHRQLQQSNEASSIIWVTDGDIDEQYHTPLDNFARKLNTDDIPVFVLDLGTVEGDAIPLEDGSWLSHNGQAVVSRSQVSLLKTIASVTKGRYSPVYDDNSDWQYLYKEGVKAHIKTNTAAESTLSSWRELYSFALLPGILLFMIAWLPYPSPLGARTSLQAAMAGLLAIIVMFAANDASANEDLLRDAHDALSNKQFMDAAKTYEQVQGYAGRFGQGVSAYRLGDYSLAINQFTQAVLQSDNDRQRQQSLYNLGNAYFKTGNYAAAVQVYRDVLEYDGSSAPATRNLALAEELQKAVELRLQQRQARAARLGRGVQSQRAEENIPIDNNALASVDDSENDGKQEQTLSELHEALLQKGVEYADLAARSTDTADSYSRDQTINEALLAMQSLENQRERLWQRIFEIEYGFAAPQEQPTRVEGVRPW